MMKKIMVCVFTLFFCGCSYFDTYVTRSKSLRSDYSFSELKNLDNKGIVVVSLVGNYYKHKAPKLAYKKLEDHTIGMHYKTWIARVGHNGVCKYSEGLFLSLIWGYKHLRFYQNGLRVGGLVVREIPAGKYVAYACGLATWGPTEILFEVFPNQITYIGCVDIDMRTMDVSRGSRYTTYSYRYNVSVTDERERDMKFLKVVYPDIDIVDIKYDLATFTKTGAYFNTNFSPPKNRKGIYFKGLEGKK